MTITQRVIARAGLILAHYIIGAYGTTDMIRLKSGSHLSVDNEKAYCPSCGHELALYEQIPIISFIVHRGKCKYCGAPIPPEHEIIETVVFVGMTLIAALSGFSSWGLLLNIAFYEIFKVIFLTTGKRRGVTSRKEVMKSLKKNTVVFMLYGVIYSFQFLG